MSKATHGDLWWIPNKGVSVTVMENKSWYLLGIEKTRLEREFPDYYGNKNIGKLKSRYREVK